MKICYKCQLEKAVTDFYKNRTRSDGLSSACKACRRSICREYNQTAAGKLSHNQSSIKYQQSSKGQAYTRKYNRSPQGVLKYKRRRERKYGLDGVLSVQDLALIRERFSHQCFNCGRNDRLEIDHHRPLSRGHGLTIDNAVLLCRSCNASKRDQSPQDFYQQEKLEVLRGYGLL
jgi:5-methylcytosine-specific restriction endonuclease McrA